MSEPSPTDLIALLAQYAARGVLETAPVLVAIQALVDNEGEQVLDAAALLEVLDQQRDPAQVLMPAIDDLISHVKEMRRSAARRYYQQRVAGEVDRTQFETLLGGLPPEIPIGWGADRSTKDLDAAIQTARERRFILARHNEAPVVASALNQRYDELINATRDVLEAEKRQLVIELINELRRCVGNELKLNEGQANAARAIGQHLSWLENQATSAPSTDLTTETDSEQITLSSLEAQFHAATNQIEQQQALDLICLWPTPEAGEVVLRLVGTDSWARDRAELIMICRFGRTQLAGWMGWENFLTRAARRNHQRLQQILREEPAELLLIWASRLNAIDPDIVAALNRYCATHTKRVDVDDFVESWADVLPAAEFNSLVGVDFEVGKPDVESVELVQADMADEPVEPRTRTVAPTATPAATVVPTARPSAKSSMWRDHIQPFLTENWYMVAGVVMVVAGASLISVFFWDGSPLIRFTLLPALLAGFTVAVAAAGSWIERQDIKFLGTGAVLRGAAIALLPINFMVVSLLAREPELRYKIFFVAAMCIAYLVLFGWGLRSWCRSVHPPLGIPLGGSLLAINCLVMIGPLAETLAETLSQSRWGTLPSLIVGGFYAGFALIVLVVVQFARRILTRELATQKRVPWFVGAMLGVTYLQVFGWVHFQLQTLPHVSTYALLVILVGWLVLFVERRAIELGNRSGDQLGGESFLGYALLLLGVLMGSFQEDIRIAAFALAGVAWLYQAIRRKDEMQHWIGLTILTLSGAAVAMKTAFPRDPWLPLVGLVLVVIMGGVHWLGRRWQMPHLSRAAIGMQPTLALLTVVVAILAQWHFRSLPPLTSPLLTACYLLAVVAIFAWRAWRDDELRWVHSAMTVVVLSLPYLGCVDMLGSNPHGNTMAFGLAVTSIGWLILVWLTKSKLLLQARSTVLLVYGSIAVAAMVLRVLFEGTSTAPSTIQLWMDYSGPLLMAVLMAIATYHTRSLLPAAMAAMIAVILFPELKARFEDTFDSLGWGTGLGSSCSALGLVLACFPLARVGWLRKLDEGDQFFGRIPFPFRRYDHTLFTWPLAASALFLIVRVDTWNIVRIAISDQSITHFFRNGLSSIPIKTAVAVCLTGVTWTLLGVLLRSRRGAVAGTHLGWISLLAGLVLGNWFIDHQLHGFIEGPLHWSWPFLVTGLVLQILDLVYTKLGTTHNWIEELLSKPTRQVLSFGGLLLSAACVVALIANGESEFAKLAPLMIFVAAQLVRSGLAGRHVAFGSFLFVLAWVSLLSVTASGKTSLLERLSFTNSLYPTLWFLLAIHAIHLGLEFSRSIGERRRPLLAPFLTGASLLTIALVVVSCSDGMNPLHITVPQRWLLLLVTLAAARNQGSTWIGLLGLLHAYLLVHQHAKELKPDALLTNVQLLIEPWRCAALGLAAAILGQSGRLLNRRRTDVLTGSFAQPVFRSPHVAWLFAPAVTLAVIATAYHVLTSHDLTALIKNEGPQLWAPFLGAGSLLIVAWSCRSQTLAWLAVSALGLGNINCVRFHFGAKLIGEYGLSEIHLVALGLVAALLQLTALRMLWRRDRVTAFVNRASLAGAALVLMLICMNYATDPNLGAIPWQRFVVSGVMAYIAGLYFRRQARQLGTAEGSTNEACEVGYHFGVTLAIWCAALLGLQSLDLLKPLIAIYALAVPVAYFYVRAELGFTEGFAHARRYRNTASVLSFAILGLWVFRAALHFVMFPKAGSDNLDLYYHYNAPSIMLLSLVMLRLHGLRGTSWLAFYGGLAMMAGSFFTLTSLPQLRLLEYPMAAAWSAIGLAHLWTILSQQQSPLRSLVQQIGRIDGPHWISLRRSWGVCMLIASQVAVLWGLVESLGLGRFSQNELQAAPLLLGAASILVHLGAIRRSAVYFCLAAFEILLALHAGFVIDSYLPRDQVIWAILGIWASGLVIWEFASRRFQARKLGTTSALLAGLTLAHVVFRHELADSATAWNWIGPFSTAALWAFAMLAVLAALTPRSTRSAKTGEERAAASMLLLVPTWLVFFSQADPADILKVPISWTWPLIATTAAIFLTGSLCRVFQARLLPNFDGWQRTSPRLFDHTLSLVGKVGATVNSYALWFCFAAAVVLQLSYHFSETVFATHEIGLLCLLYAAYSLAWYFEGQLRRTVSAYIVLQLCVLGFFGVLRKQLMLTTYIWTQEYDVWASLVVSFAICGAKQMLDMRPREIRIPLIGTLLTLPVVALIWVAYHRMGSDIALIVVGLHSLMFTFLGKERRDSPYNMVAVGGFVAFVLIFFGSRLEHLYLHAFVIPVGLGVLVLLQLFRERIAVEVRNRIRLVTLIAMLSTSGFYALIDFQHALLFNLMMIVLCLLSMALGSFLRIRLYLLLGFVGLLVDVAAIIFKVIRASNVNDQRPAIGALLLLIGIGMIAGAIYYKTHRQRINSVIDRWRKRLGEWE